MAEYEDEESRTIFCANLSDKVTEALLYELFLQGGPLEKIAQPKDKDGRARAFAFITYAHAVSVPYAVNLFQGTQLFNRELTIKPRINNNQNSNVQQRMENPMPQPPQPLMRNNPFDANARFGGNGNGRFDRNHQPNPGPQFDQSSSLRSGFNPIPTKASMQMQPQLPQRSNNQQQVNPTNIDLSKLLSMGQNMFQMNSRQSDMTARPAYDMLFADRDRQSSNMKMTNRHKSRPHHRDEPYARRSPPRNKQRSGDRRRR